MLFMKEIKQPRVHTFDPGLILKPMHLLITMVKANVFHLPI
jgi:hypothetical protein